MAKGEVLAVPRIELCVEREGASPRAGPWCSTAISSASAPPEQRPRARRPRRLPLPLHPRAREVHVPADDVSSLNGTTIAGVRARDADAILPEYRIELGESVVRIRDADAVAETELRARLSFGALQGVSVPMRHLFPVLDRVAKSAPDVLIEGENGTGKEVIATELVQRGARADKPLVIVDCGAISPSLIESELFGHAARLLHGRHAHRAGAFEEADGGTVFLDDPSRRWRCSRSSSAPSPRARCAGAPGESRVRKVDIRVIAATNRRLEREVNSGRFREDLYYRLSVLTVRVPAAAGAQGGHRPPRPLLPERARRHRQGAPSSPPRSSRT